MDLEQYRRTYMQTEGMGNTPINLIKRYVSLGKNIGGMNSAIKKDQKIRKAKRAQRKAAFKDISENGLSLNAVKNIITSGPGFRSNVTDQLEKVGDSAVSAARSSNELGSTTANIIGGRNGSMYNGHDLEDAVRFSLYAKSAIAKGLRLPSKLLDGAVALGTTSGMIYEFSKNKFEAKEAVRANVKEHSRDSFEFER